MKSSAGQPATKPLNLLRRVLQRILRSHYLLERFVLYRNPRRYWNQRGGEIYFKEQEHYQSRQKRSEWITSEIAQLPVEVILEVGCGYGKQIKNLLQKKKVTVYGMDFSHAQLLKARSCLPPEIPLCEADAANLPFPENSFDLVYSSAVILHNDRRQAKGILREMIRVSRGYLLHNEDKNRGSIRFAYDLFKFYQELGFETLKRGQIPIASDPERTQFLIVRFSEKQKKRLTQDLLDVAFQKAATIL